MRVASLILIFLVAFLGVSWGIREARPEPLGHGRRLKYEHLVEHSAEYTMVLIGSSRVNHSLVPSIMEERLAQAGHSHRVYNYGIGGMRAFEADQVLETVLALDLPALEVVVIEWPDWDGVIYGDDDSVTERAAQWHTLERTWTALESLHRSELPWKVALHHALDHLKLAFARVGNYGAGSTWLQRRLGANEFEDLPEVVVRDGFAATGEIQERTPEQEAFRIAKTDLLLSRKHIMDAGNGLPSDEALYNREALARQAELAAERGVRIVWALMPGEKHVPAAWRLAEREPDLPLLLFNSPERYPELYTAATRWDPDHLNEHGAELFSATFADELVKLLDRP